MSFHLGNVMLSAVEKSSGLAGIQVQMKKSAHEDYGSCYNVGHCESSSFSSTLPRFGVAQEEQHGLQQATSQQPGIGVTLF